MGFNMGQVYAFADWSPRAIASVEQDTSIVSAGDIRVQAWINHLADGQQDDDREINLNAWSNGGALFAGRHSYAMAKIAPEAWSLVKSGAELTANYDILVSARSHSYLDGKSNTRLFGLAGESFATTLVNVWISTRAEILDSSTPSVLNAGDDIDIDSYTNWEGIAFAKAKAPTPLAIRESQAYVRNYEIDTLSRVGTDNQLTAGHDITVFAYKYSADCVAIAEVVLGWSDAEVANFYIPTTADVDSSSTLNVGNLHSATAQGIDPIRSTARAIIQDDRRVSDEDYQQLVAGGHIGARAATSTRADIHAGFDPGAKVSGGKTRVVSELKLLKSKAEAKFQTKRNKDGLLTEVESLDLTVRAELPGVDLIEKRFTEEPSRGLRYKAKITSDGNGSRPPQTVRGSDTPGGDQLDWRWAAMDGADSTSPRRWVDPTGDRPRDVRRSAERGAAFLQLPPGDLDREFAVMFADDRGAALIGRSQEAGLDLTDGLFADEGVEVDDLLL